MKIPSFIPHETSSSRTLASQAMNTAVVWWYIAQEAKLQIYADGISTEKVCMANLNIPVLSGSRLPNLSTSSRELCWIKRKAPKAVH